MATIIQVKRTTTANLPSTLEQGELAYIYDTSATDTDAGGNGGRLYIGDPTTNTNTPLKVGGKYYTDMMDHAQGTLTADAAVLVDSSSKIDVWNVDNLTLNGNTLSSTDTNGNINITPNGAGSVVIDGLSHPQADGTSGQFLKTDGSGNLSFATVTSSFTLSADSGANDTFNTGGTLTFSGGTGIDTTVSDDQISIAIDSTVATLTGSQTLTNKTLTSPTINTATIDLGADLTMGNNNIVFEGATADDFETTVTVTDPTADRTITLPDVSGTVITTGNGSDLTFQSNIVFEGATADDFETTLAVTDPTADRTVTFQDATGTVVLRDTTDTLTNKTIDTANNTITIVEADISDLGSYITASSTDTLTNKSISGSTNTLSNIGNSSLTNSTITITGSDASSDSIALGETLTIANGEGIVTDIATNTLTITAEDASTSNKGVASFDTDHFTVTSGAVTIKSGSIANGDLAGSIGNDKLANSSITVSDGSNSTATSLGGTITFSGTANEVEVGESSGTITVGLPNDVTIGNDLTVTGDLTVNGTTTTVATTNTVVSDTLLELGNGTTGAPANDSGIVIERGDSNNAFIGFDESADKFIVGTGTFTGASTGNLTITTGTIVANLEATTATLGGSDIISTDNTKTLTNKTIDAASNTLSNIGNASLSNSTITLAGDSGSQAVDLGDTLTVSGGEGIDTSQSGDTLTIAAELATTSNKGVASFSSDNFQVSTGVVTVTTVDGGTY